MGCKPPSSAQGTSCPQPCLHTPPIHLYPKLGSAGDSGRYYPGCPMGRPSPFLRGFRSLVSETWTLLAMLQGPGQVHAVPAGQPQDHSCRRLTGASGQYQPRLLGSPPSLRPACPTLRPVCPNEGLTWKPSPSSYMLNCLSPHQASLSPHLSPCGSGALSYCPSTIYTAMFPIMVIMD